MTWRSSIRRHVDDVFGVWVGLTAKETNRIRAAGSVSTMGALMPKLVCELQR
jgi:hypothetical protein